jgi:acetylornithine aminotransferase
MNTYARLPVAFERGEGSWLWDANGKRYLDAMAGVAVCGLGHSHPRYVAALREQVGKLVHTSNLYQITLQEKLADRLAAISGMDNVFARFEAKRSAIKPAAYGPQEERRAPAIVVLRRHSTRTLATLTGSPRCRRGSSRCSPAFSGCPSTTSRR